MRAFCALWLSVATFPGDLSFPDLGFYRRLQSQQPLNRCSSNRSPRLSNIVPRLLHGLAFFSCQICLTPGGYWSTCRRHETKAASAAGSWQREGQSPCTNLIDVASGNPGLARHTKLKRKQILATVALHSAAGRREGYPAHC